MMPLMRQVTFYCRLLIVSIITNPNPKSAPAGRTSDCRMCVKMNVKSGVNSFVRNAEGSIVKICDLTDVICFWTGLERADLASVSVRDRNRYVSMLVDSKCIRDGVFVYSTSPL